MISHPPEPIPVGSARALPGHATAAGTARRAARASQRPANFFAALGGTGLVTSRAGFGCYRVADGKSEHADALREALRAGVNLIDTSTNYTDGASERLVGLVLGELIGAGELQRDEVIVVSKIGYIQGENMTLARSRQQAGRPFAEVVEYDEQCWHCIHPDFLADQLARSLGRLGLATLDVLLLHNPEYFLAAHKQGATPPSARAEYERRLRAAFGWMESQVTRGTIRAYGVSSNTFPEPATTGDFTSLERCVALAREAAAGAESGFRVVQLPGNLLERGLSEERSQAGGAATVLDVAAREGLAVLVNRPLNAFHDKAGLVRLAGVPSSGEPLEPEEIAALLKAIEAPEAAVLAVLPEGTPLREQAAKLLRHRAFLASNLRHVHDLEHWKQVVEFQLGPMLEFGLGAVRAYAGEMGEPALARRADDAANAYHAAVGKALIRLGGHFAASAEERAAMLLGLVEEAARQAGHPLPVRTTLGQAALACLLGLPALPTVLVGMRRVEYVNETVGTFDQYSQGWPAPALFSAAGQALERALGH